MKSFYVSITMIVLFTIFPAQESKSELFQNSIQSVFRWINFDEFRTSYLKSGSFDFNVKTQIIRRKEYKRGTMPQKLDSTLNEYIVHCLPIRMFGDTSCPYFYRYYLVDSLWIVGKPADKYHHRVVLRRAVLSDTIISDADAHSDDSKTDPSISALDQLLDKTIYASITVRVSEFSSDGLNTQRYWSANINRLWLKRPK